LDAMGAELSAEAPAAAPADAEPGEASTSIAAAAPPPPQVAEPKPPEPPPPPAGPTPVDAEVFKPDEVVAALHAVTNGDRNVAMVEACCKRVRVLCREIDMCRVCDQAGAAAAVVKAMQALPNETRVQLQALAAIVNLCSGENNEHRSKAVASGALPMIVDAMKALIFNPEVQEMGCIALQNCCYGEDEQAIERRRGAAAAGAISAVVDAMKQHESIPAAQEVGVATLRLIVHKVPELRQTAVNAGANPDWVKPISKEGGGILSFRKGFGTSRRVRAQQKAQQQAGN